MYNICNPNVWKKLNIKVITCIIINKLIEYRMRNFFNNAMI